MNPRLLLPRLRQLAVENKLFTLVLAAGAFLRLLAGAGYPGALWFAGDSYVYLGAALRPRPDLSKSTAYSIFLRMLLPFHSLTLVTAVQHLMGLGTGVMIYVLLRRARVSKKWAAIATMPQLLGGYILEDEHLIMAEALFTFLLMIALLMILWRREPGSGAPAVRWWVAAIAGLLVAAAALVRTEGAVILPLIPLFLLISGRAWKTIRGWLAAAAFTVAALVPVGAYAQWFDNWYGHYGMTMSTGYYLWGRVSSFADCAVIQPTGRQKLVCPTTPIADRTPPGNYIWHTPFVHANLDASGGPVNYQNNQLLTDFAIHAVEAQPLDYAKTVFFDTMMSFGFPRIAYPGAGTTYYYDFHLHYVTSTYNMLPPKDTAWIGPRHDPADSAYHDWLAYGGQAPGVVHKIFAVPILAYQRLVFTYGPLLALIFLIGLGGVISVTADRRGRGLKSIASVRALRSVRLHWRPRGTPMLPWMAAVALLVLPIAVADFDYRYLIPAIPFACLAAGLAFAPRRNAPADGTPAAPASVESTVPDSVS